jgi:Fe-S cluster biosynthesis and repair protein YggX
MTSLADRIAQFRKMATDDPENELAHFRLGQLLMEDGQFAEAATSFARTLVIEPSFSKVYQLLGECHFKLGETAEGIAVLTTGYGVADAKGDKMPRDAMAKLLTDNGAPVPTAETSSATDDGPETGFRCARPMCTAGKRAKPLAAAPVRDAIGRRIYETICTDCWNGWFKDYSIKVINELRLDLSNEYGQNEYDKHMREFFGFEDQPAETGK